MTSPEYYDLSLMSEAELESLVITQRAEYRLLAKGGAKKDLKEEIDETEQTLKALILERESVELPTLLALMRAEHARRRGRKQLALEKSIKVVSGQLRVIRAEKRLADMRFSLARLRIQYKRMSPGPQKRAAWRCISDAVQAVKEAAML